MIKSIKIYAFIAANIITLNCLFGEIKNGYAPKIQGFRESLKRLNSLLTDGHSLPFFKRQRIKQQVHAPLEAIAYFKLTEELLDQFRAISPGLYYEIDNIKNCKGESVDVYVKLVSEDQMLRGASATTNLSHSDRDFTVYRSEYGLNTVAIKIASIQHSRILLAHEFGHVKYQVPNLATYLEYYRKHYQNSTFKSNYIGHNMKDPSGLKALEYESIHREDYLNFLKTSFKVESRLSSKKSRNNLNFRTGEY